MQPQNAPDSNGLENQMRNMILGNVSTPGGQTNHDVQSTQHRRDRGRGGSYRGSDRRHQHRAGPVGEGSSKGVGRAYPSGFHYQQPQNFPQAPRGSGNAQYAASGDQSRRPAPRPLGTYQQSTVPGGPVAARTQVPKVLQRPQNDAILPISGQASLATSYYARPHYSNRPPMKQQPKENPVAQAEYLEDLAAQEIPKVEMSLAELKEKEAFRNHLEIIVKQALSKDYSGDIETIALVGFGSLTSGFGLPGSDMDLAVVPEWKNASKLDEVAFNRDIPRLLERAILDAKMGGRLLTRTRVPILKICQNPTAALYAALFEERKKWDELPEEEKYPIQLPPVLSPHPKPVVGVDAERSIIVDEFPSLGTTTTTKAKSKPRAKEEPKMAQDPKSVTQPVEDKGKRADKAPNHAQHPRSEKPWMREKIMGPLDFPKTGVGIQCDVNFGNPLGIHNSHMLRCYSLTDPRVRPIVLFVKSWAKTRKVNSSYSGTLSSYGWVLMVLHYLVNIATPPVCPNLQLRHVKETTKVNGYSVQFWCNEQEIMQEARAGRLSTNTQSIGALLRGFFQYFASIPPAYNYGPRPHQFYWTSEVLSLRTQGGILTKQMKGWVSATTKITAEKKVTNRYLFAIEDPFEVDHNVARTVTHPGIVTIRDEFRRAWRILSAIGQGLQPEGGIFDEVVENTPPPARTEARREQRARKRNDGDTGHKEANTGLDIVQQPSA